MRPLELQVEGFTCFRDRQTVDFRPLGLFAIAGPTGAGKSSLLDAMVYALFGHIPRVGKHGVSEFVSLGRDRMAVTFTFDVGGRIYRVSRIGYRKQQTRVQLEVGDQPVADSVRVVDERMEEILGLTAETFQQSVLLPQGQFSKFLKATPKEQRVILRDLLRLGVYEELRRSASARATTAESAAGDLRRRLDEDYAGVSEDAVRGLEAERGGLEEQIRDAAEALEARRTALTELQARAEAWGELRTLEATRAGLEARRDAVQADRNRWDAAQRASSVLPLLRAAERARADRADAEKAVNDRRALLDQKTQASTQAAQALERAQEAARRVPELEAQAAKLEGAVVLLGPRDQARERVTGEQGERDRLGKKVAEHQAAIAAQKQRLAELDGQLADLDDQIASSGYDPAVHDRLREAKGAAERARVARDESRKAQTEASQARKRRVAAEQSLAEKRTAVDDAHETLEVATRTWEEAHQRQVETERRNHAHVLREHLTPGHPCPVCEQAVDVVPAPGAVLELGEVRDREARARGAVDQAKAAHHAASVAAGKAEAELEQARATEAEKQAAASARAEVLAGLEREIADRADLEALDRADPEGLRRAVPEGLDLAEGLGPAGAAPPRGEVGSTSSGAAAGESPPRSPVAGPIEELVFKRLWDLGQRQARHAALEQQRPGLVEERGRVEGVLTRATADLEAATASLELARTRLADAIVARDALEAQIRAVTSLDDPATEQERVRREVQALRDQESGARDAHAAADRQRAVAEGDLRSAEDALGREASRVAAAEAEAEREARSRGFESAVDAQAAGLAADEAESLRTRIDGWEAEVQRVGAQIEQVRARAGEVEPSAGQVAGEAQEVARLEQQLGEQRTALGSTDTRLKDARDRLETAVRLEREWSDARARHATFDHIADDLRTDRFEKWLLDGTFRGLVEGASVRLLEMSGRYTLDYREDEFWVVDHDNAGERRKADTLSGGETFLASLCLALQLSEQVQRASGAVRLDSLFIDEGFGTLDPETLDTVAGAIEALGAGDRMVGIITHVKELTERLPARIVVRKGAEGSRVDLG